MAMEPTKHQFSVENTNTSRRLDRVLAERLTEFSRTRLKALIIDGCVTVNMTPHVDPAFRVSTGDKLIITVPPARSSKPKPQRIPLNVIYEDDELIVIDKPPKLVVHPAPGHPDKTLVNALLSHCGSSLSGIGGVRRPGIVHRLDKDTSGLLVAAKNDAAHRYLTELFATKRIKRKYKAIVLGHPSPCKNTILSNIGRNPKNRKKMAVVLKGGKPAETFYQLKTIFRNGEASLVVCELATGRTHQIRVHMAEAGHPVLGDPLYGGHRGLSPHAASPTIQLLREFPRQALHAFELHFIHPKTVEPMVFVSELPPDMKTLVNSLVETR
jgi:23S rRNA pseudouridine1911/1915/1917 synthase